MAFIEPMHRNKPNITYLLTCGDIITNITTENKAILLAHGLKNTINLSWVVVLKLEDMSHSPFQPLVEGYQVVHLLRVACHFDGGPIRCCGCDALNRGHDGFQCFGTVVIL